jgi:phthalate 4,5-cis-dihydrodiol dehydrogenase
VAQVIEAAEAGKHVYVEKPMARSVGECREMIAAAEQSGVRLMVGESYFFHGPHTPGLYTQGGPGGPPGPLGLAIA